ncbi:hypothetical protein FB440_101122 [Vibrio crassostreae]|uniref:hypothetical protein n=1 Tax=Vibrio crassostreae TaxID=246167 RepID=UPI0006346C4D|nr:hypothetical protein [Vibrio crassostreae]TCN66950.1 hypothetical protein EDB60_110141 [Vibrio crassostreae]TCO00559.1 hypothetical protein EDB30_111132 [Vibrio crassostreae]TCV29237.1 hypothetical protein EDB71_104107 [Vibrio crassostreae]TCW20184.1 hypothetical protein EDB48_104130 [Vibrio crassostreae]TWD43209.1 hypothetical protein FB440_101122 [Vibrio crassostreae]
MQSLTANTAKTKFGDLLMKVQREPLKLMFVKSRFEQAEADALSGNLVDGNDFMNALDQGKIK